MGPERDSDLSIGTHGERALSDAPLAVLHVSDITALPVSRHKGDAKPRSEGAVARVGVGRIHWKFDGLTEEGRQAQLSPKVRCRESSTAVRALASAFKTRKIKKKYRGARFVRNRIDRKTPPDHRRAACGLKAYLLVDPPFVSGPFARFVKKNEPRAASRERARGSSPRSTRASRGNPSGTTSRP